MPNYSILALGDPYIDHILPVSEDFLSSLPGIKGGTLTVSELEFREILSLLEEKPLLIPGGSAANTARALAHLGQSCALLGKVGSDDLGEFFLQEIAPLSITPLLSEASLPTGQVLCLITPDGERTHRTLVGSAGQMTPADVKTEYFKGVKLVHLEGYTLRNQELALHTARLAKASGAYLSMDLASFELVEQYKVMIQELLINYVDILFCNHLEARALTKKNGEESAKELGKICPLAVVTMGKDGCWIKRGDETHHYPALSTRPKDCTGAGDYFSAGFLHGWLNRAPLKNCAAIGALIAQSVIQNDGPIIHSSRWETLLPHVHKILLSCKKS